MSSPRDQHSTQTNAPSKALSSKDTASKTSDDGFETVAAGLRLEPKTLEEILTRFPAPNRSRVIAAWRKTVTRLFPMGGISRDNFITLYFDGDTAFAAMLDAIDSAHSRVWIETYIFASDGLGTLVRDALIRAAERGCAVTLLYDQWGSQEIARDFFAPLKLVGGDVVVFNPVAFSRPFKLWFRLWNKDKAPIHFRDHRKILIVDDKYGFAGGMNISEDYAGPELGNGRFRDTHARVEGPAIVDLARVFLDSYGETQGKRAGSPTVGPPTSVARPGKSLVQVLGSNVRRRRLHIQRSVRETVQHSVDHCYVTSPYFVPPRKLLRALTSAAKRGVDVRVLTAGLSDVPIVRVASSHLYPLLLKRGVRVFEMQERTLHAKTTTIDGVYSTVGSFNLDFWSHKRLLEVNVAILDPTLATELEDQFETDLKIAVEVKLETLGRRSWFSRLVAWLAYKSMRL